jgi:ABC-type multidrug transport system fused ATPase/permease subunit
MHAHTHTNTHTHAQVGGEGGLQLSAGQQQLLCLARALLRRSRLVLLDECTSSVDPPTAALMRAVLAQHLGDRRTTVLQIAHDLRAIMGYDRVLLMDRGRVVEDGAPRALAAAGETRFAQLLARAGRAAGAG